MVKHEGLIFWRYDLVNKRMSFKCIKCKEKFMSAHYCKSRKDTYLCLECASREGK